MRVEKNKELSAEISALHARLVQVARTRAALDAQEAADLYRADTLRVFREYGYSTMYAYMESELGYGPHAASERLRVAYALVLLPATRERFAAGDLHYSVVRELTRVAAPATEKAWLAVAAGKNVRQVELLVAGHRQGDLPEAPPDPALIKQRMYLELTPAVYALFRQVRKQLDEEHGERLDDAQTIEALCRRALAPAIESTRPASQIAYMVCPECGGGTQDGAGVVVHASQAELERARCMLSSSGMSRHPLPRESLRR